MTISIFALKHVKELSMATITSIDNALVCYMCMNVTHQHAFMVFLFLGSGFILFFYAAFQRYKLQVIDSFSSLFPLLSEVIFAISV